MRFNYHFMPLIAAICLSTFTIDAQQKITAESMPEHWIYSEGFDQTQPTYDNWWKGFNDHMLDSLINIGIANNYDVLTAKRRIEMARQNIRRTESQYYPAISLDAGFTQQRTSGVTTQVSAPATTMRYLDLGANMSWQIDVFGKIAAQAKESKANFRASKAQYDAMTLTISAKIASAYLQLRMLQAQMSMLEQHITQQKRVLDITEARHEVGLASMLDVTQATTTYLSTQATVTSINSSIISTINSIAVLIGVYPRDITPYLIEPAPMPDYHQLVAVGIPMDLLRRRPDIAEAEETLAGYAAALGVAKKDFLPTLSINGAIGTMARDPKDMFTDRSFTYSIAPTLSWTVFEGFGRQASVQAAKEQLMAGVETYNQTVLTAVQEADNAMATYYNDLKYIDLVTRLVEQAHKSFDLSIDLYKQGLTAFINVTNAQIGYLQYSSELVSAQGQALLALVTLNEALGGGWSQDN